MSRKQDKDGQFVDTRSGKAAPFTYPKGDDILPEERFDWGNVDSVLLQRAIDAVTGRGHSISFAVNLRHTTGTITILAGDERPKWTGLEYGVVESVLRGLIEPPF